MDCLLEIRHLKLRDIGKGEGGDVEERLRGIIGAQRLHDNLVDGNVETVGNAFGEESEDLVDGEVVLHDEVVVQAVEEANLDERRVERRGWNDAVRRTNDLRD